MSDRKGKSTALQPHKILETLRQKMTIRQKKLLSKTFVSHFLNLPTSNFPTQLLLQIIRRRVPNSNKNILSFNIEGVEIDFTMKDFALLTGLNCEEVRYVSVEKLPQSTIERDFLQNYASPKLTNLLDKIKEYDFVDDDLSVKLAKLAILESIIIAKIPKNRMESLHLRLVEDEDQFESYPWGRVAYEHLVDSVEHSAASQRLTSMSIPGFVYAFIYWAYEIIPTLSLSERYGKRIGNDTPRILNWDVYHTTDSKKLMRDVFNDKINVVPMLPTVAEMELDCLAPFSTMDDSLFDDEDEYAAGGRRYRNDEGATDMSARRQWDEGCSAGEERGQETRYTNMNDFQALILRGFTSINEKLTSIFERLDKHQIGTGEVHGRGEQLTPSPLRENFTPVHTDDIRYEQINPTPPHETFNTVQISDWPTWVAPKLPEVVVPQQTKNDGADIRVLDSQTEINPEEESIISTHALNDEIQELNQEGNVAKSPVLDGDLGTPNDSTNTDKPEEQEIQQKITRGARPPRSTKPGHYEKEPYTTTFGSSGSKPKRKRVDTRAADKKRGRGGLTSKTVKRGSKTK